MFTPGLVALVPRSASCGDLLTFGCYHSRTIVSSQALVGSSQWWVPRIVQESQRLMLMVKQGTPPRYTLSLQKSAKTDGNRWTETSTLGLLHYILPYVVDQVRVCHRILYDYRILTICRSLTRLEQTVALLLSHRAISPNGVHPPGSGTTPLHLAASLGRLDVVNLLLDQEAIDDSLRDNQGRTCRDVARGKDVVRAIDGTRLFASAFASSYLPI